MSRATLEETLEKYEISPAELVEWEIALGLTVPVDAQGQKRYTRQHLNLFKNVKKHLALGRSLDHIRRIINLPPATEAKEVMRDVRQAWSHVPKITGTLTAEAPRDAASPAVTPVAMPAHPTAALSLQSDALLEQFKEHARELVQPEHESVLTTTGHPLTDFPVNTPPTQEEPALPVPATPEPASPIPSSVQGTTPYTPEMASVPVSSPASASVQREATEPLRQAPVNQTSERLTAPGSSLQVSREAVPIQVAAAPVATALLAPSSESLQIVDRLITEKDALQQRVIEAEKLNSHLYNINGLFNKKVKELTQLVNTLKQNHNEEEVMNLMQDKSRLQKDVLDAERGRMEAFRQMEAARQEAHLSNQACEALKQELQASRTAFDAQRFMGNWKEALVLQEIQFDTFGLNVENQREQHRLIDTPPNRIIGNVAFMSTRFAYPDNELWQRHETLTCIMLEEHFAKGELQVDYVLDGVTVCRAIYLATLKRLN
jgi:DNA-binding transcriptional MerR regulator